MISRGLLAVLKLHVRQQMLSRAFVVSTVLMPVMMIALIYVQSLLTNLNKPEPSQLLITSDSPTLLESVRSQLDLLDEVRDGIYRVEFQHVTAQSFDDYLAGKRELLLRNSNNGLFQVPATALDDKQIRFYSSNVGNQVVRQAIGRAINQALNHDRFAALGMQPADLDYAVDNVDISGFTVSREGAERGSLGNFAVGIGLAVLLVISMMGIVMPFSAAVIEERSNRAVEVLLTSVSPAELLAGKIGARAITGLVQMLVWLIPLFVFVLFPATMLLPPELSIDIGIGTLLFFLANYVLGLTVLLALWGGFSAMFDSTQDANQALWPITLLMWMPFYAVFAVMRNPANSVAEILSLAPFTSMYVMPMRLAIVEVPFWQPLLALLLNALLLWGAVIAGGKIYRLSILATGQQPTLAQFVTWLRQA